MISKEGFADIYEEFFPKLYGYVFHRVNDSVVTEDIVSQVFFKALKNLERYDESKWQISTWLYTITSNTLIDHYRKDEEFASIEDFENHFFTEESTSSDIDFEIDINKIRLAIKKLPTKTQEIISLRIFEDLSFVEISKIIWIWESWVKMSFLRWIEAIKNWMNLLILIIFLLLR